MLSFNVILLYPIYFGRDFVTLSALTALSLICVQFPRALQKKSSGTAADCSAGTMMPIQRFLRSLPLLTCPLLETIQDPEDLIAKEDGGQRLEAIRWDRGWNKKKGTEAGDSATS